MLCETLIRRVESGRGRGLSCARYHALRDRHGDDHPATRAALARFRFYLQMIPQRGNTVESIAWHRESGVPGFRNRTQRKHYEGRQPIL